MLPPAQVLQISVTVIVCSTVVGSADCVIVTILLWTGVVSETDAELEAVEPEVESAEVELLLRELVMAEPVALADEDAELDVVDTAAGSTEAEADDVEVLLATLEDDGKLMLRGRDEVVEPAVGAAEVEAEEEVLLAELEDGKLMLSGREEARVELLLADEEEEEALGDDTTLLMLGRTGIVMDEVSSMSCIEVVTMRKDPVKLLVEEEPRAELAGVAFAVVRMVVVLAGRRSVTVSVTSALPVASERTTSEALEDTMSTPELTKASSSEVPISVVGRGSKRVMMVGTTVIDSVGALRVVISLIMLETGIMLVNDEAAEAGTTVVISSTILTTDPPLVMEEAAEATTLTTLPPREDVALAGTARVTVETRLVALLKGI